MKTQLGFATVLKIISPLIIIILLFGCENSGSPVRSDESDINPITFTEAGDPSRISHIRTYFSMSHQGIAVDDKYIYGIFQYFISITEKESGKSTSYDFLYNNNAFRDYTDEMNDYVLADVELMAADAAVGDAFYFGGFERYRSLIFSISNAGNGSWDFAWEYWNGNNWTGLPGLIDGTDCFRNWGSSLVLYDFPQDWERTVINGGEAFYIRARITSILSLISPPIANWIFVGRYTMDDAPPASTHFSDGTVETENGIRYLYVIGPGDDDIDGKIIRYSVPELNFEGIEHSWTHGLGNFSGVDKHDIDGVDYWWVIWDISDHNVSQNTITRYNMDWTNPVDYPLKYSRRESFNYQGFTWWSNGINDYIFANVHGPYGTTDIYKWNGQDFTALKRLNQVTSRGFEASQGFTWEEDTGYLWASARGNGAYSAFKCRVKFNNDSQPDPSINTIQ